MWISKEIVSNENKDEKSFFGKITDANAANLVVQADRECRAPKIILPFGVASVPSVGSKVVLTQVNNEYVLLGSLNSGVSLSPGELMLYSAGGASIVLKNSGEVLINGKEYS